MRKILFLLCLSLLYGCISCTQLPYEKKKVSKDKELNLTATDKQGISDAGFVYYVESDRKNISAYQNDKLRWRTNVIDSYHFDIVGLPQIRFIKLEDKTLHIVFGKHNFADI